MTYLPVWTGKRCHMNVHHVFFREPYGKSYKELLVLYWIVFVTPDNYTCILHKYSINDGRLEK